MSMIKDLPKVFEVEIKVEFLKAGRQDTCEDIVEILNSPFDKFSINKFLRMNANSEVE